MNYERNGQPQQLRGGFFSIPDVKDVEKMLVSLADTARGLRIGPGFACFVTRGPSVDSTVLRLKMTSQSVPFKESGKCFAGGRHILSSSQCFAADCWYYRQRATPDGGVDGVVVERVIAVPRGIGEPAAGWPVIVVVIAFSGDIDFSLGNRIQFHPQIGVMQISELGISSSSVFHSRRS